MRIKNTSLWLVSSATIVFLALVVYVPFLRSLFGFTVMHFNDIIICFIAGIASIMWFEGVKYINRQRGAKNVREL